jgi:phospholipid/cholesterol/gamma-HCH transport system permease protein
MSSQVANRSATLKPTSVDNFIQPAQIFIEETGHAVLFLLELLSLSIRGQVNRKTLFEQLWKVTTQSLPTTMMAGFFVGAVMTVQFTLQMRSFDALSYLGGLATSGTFREVGPLLIGFMLCGKVGAFTAAELGTMRITEQFDAIRCLGANPLVEVILPRFWAIIFSSFFLFVGGLVASVFGGLFLGVFFAGVAPEEYLRYIPRFLIWPSILSGFFKSFIFSFTLALVCTFKGYFVTGGAKGVGRAVVSTAVTTMIALVFFDWLTSFLMEAILVLVGGTF